MHSNLSIFLLLLPIWGCGFGNEAIDEANEISTRKNSSQQVEIQEETLPTEPEEPTQAVYPYLNNKNVESFLTEYGKKHPQTKVKMTTPFGEILLKLYKDTPLHRANFIYLINRGYFKNVEMTRVVKDFVVQGGNSDDTRPAMMRNLLGSYTIPSEFRFHHIHKKGALALSRQYEDNPDKRSSPYDFYFADGTVPGTMGIFKAEQNRGQRYTDAQVDVYKAVGGTIHLDQEHTVFGEITKGMSVLDKMANVETDGSNWPRESLTLTIELLD